MKLHALWLRALDILNAFGAPPYLVPDAQAYNSARCYYALKTALDVADPLAYTAKEGLESLVSINGVDHHFTRDRFGRLHLPKAIRERML